MRPYKGPESPSDTGRTRSLRRFIQGLRKRRVVETLAAFVGGGWLLVEVVERLFVAHYGFPEETIDIAVLSVLGAMLSTLAWRFLRGGEKARGKVRLELLVVPWVLLLTAAVDAILVLRVSGVSKAEPFVGGAAFLLGIFWTIFKLSQWASDRAEGTRPGLGVLEEDADGPGPRGSIAVLPFADLSPEKDQGYFCDGLAEDIIDALTHIPGLRVVARTSAFSFRGKEADVREIGARLNVGHVLEGSARRIGNRVRVTAQLVKAGDGFHLWSQHYDREMTDVFSIQDEISRAIVERLQIRLAATSPLIKRYTSNLEAYDLCLKARGHLLKMTPEGRDAGRRYCEEAVALDPGYALAHVMLAESYFWSAFWGSMDPRGSFSRAKAAALEAIRLDDTIADAHSALGTVLGCGEFDWRGAEREFARALELRRDSLVSRYDFAWCYAMWFLLPLGRIDQAILEIRRALELDPLDPFYNSLLGCLLYLDRQFDAAIAQLRHAIHLDPVFFFGYWFLSMAYMFRNRIDDAVAAAEKARTLSGEMALMLGALGRVYGAAGREAEARYLLETLEARRGSGYVPATAFASVYGGLKDLDKSLEWTVRSVEERDPITVTSLQVSPHYDRLRQHPRYRELLKRMNLEA